MEGRRATLPLQFFGASAPEVFAPSGNPDPGLKHKDQGGLHGGAEASLSGWW